jgi:6-phosphofructokinase 1
MLGSKAVDFAKQGVSKCMLTLKRVSDNPYKTIVETADIKEIANEAKSIPRQWINEEGNDVTQALVDYMKPLIVGEPEIRYENGIPVYLPVTHLNLDK